MRGISFFNIAETFSVKLIIMVIIKTILKSMWQKNGWYSKNFLPVLKPDPDFQKSLLSKSRSPSSWLAPSIQGEILDLESASIG
jgi:hypothetical protein